MEITPKQLDLFKEFLELQQLWITLNEDWSSRKTDHKYKLRTTITERLAFLLDHRAFSEVTDPSYAKLELKAIVESKAPPTTTFASISISHCPFIGGFTVTPQPMQIGLDVESTMRLANSSAAQRVSTPEEVVESPNPSYLWVAKESAFKSLNGPYQPAVISNIIISNWKSLDENIWGFHFQAESPSDLIHTGKGIIFNSQRLNLGIAIS